MHCHHCLPSLDQLRCCTLFMKHSLCHSLHRRSSTALVSLSPLPVTFLVLPHPFETRDQDYMCIKELCHDTKISFLYYFPHDSSMFNSNRSHLPVLHRTSTAEAILKTIYLVWQLLLLSFIINPKQNKKQKYQSID